MLNKLQRAKNKNKETGFTIIEVMIVLAIAALILLIVLLAVPALNRSSKNTSLRSAANDVAGAINTFTSDNDGTAPVCATLSSSTLTIGAAPVAPSTSCSTGENVSLPAGVSLGTTGSTNGIYTAAPGSPSANTIYIVSGYTCAGPTSLSNTNTTTNSMAIVYYLNTGTALGTLQCVNAS